MSTCFAVFARHDRRHCAFNFFAFSSPADCCVDKPYTQRAPAKNLFKMEGRARLLLLQFKMNLK